MRISPRDTRAFFSLPLAFTLMLGAGLAAGCAEEEYPEALWAQQHGQEAGAGDGSPENVANELASGTCRLPLAQPLPARLATMASGATSASIQLIYENDLFASFVSICGSCHGPRTDPPGLGNFRIADAVTFSSTVTPAILAHVTSNANANNAADPVDPMPPAGAGGMPFSSRSSTDPVRQFATLVQAWLDAGKPASFPASGQGVNEGGAPDATPVDAGVSPSPYALTSTSGNAMSNLGSCIPDTALVAHAAVSEQAKALDAMFASAKGSSVGTPAQQLGLPEHLSGTDFNTMDTAALAANGVLAFQPNYPLWSDNAGKLRFVRVPLGKTIAFDKAKQEFVIPDNTRFYKTFMRQVVDTDGSIRWRKIETRIIVARADTNNADGTATINALFGTYAWNAEETDAVLLQTPLNDGHPFADTTLLVTTDEQLAADLLSQKPQNPDEVLVAGGAARHYAIPSSERCVQCHMGSNSQSFVLGFRPVQLKRRTPGEGGTLIEPGQRDPGADELSQLQRFIAYGVLSGIGDDPGSVDILPLENSEGTRVARTSQELTAQGYLTGNCAHCHNPRGFPTVTNPVLNGVLDFLPSASGGIFQFPLERMSPRIQRGSGGTTPIPYITPSLTDILGPIANNLNLDATVTTAGGGVAYAPWRSLIYRNVDTPFTYTNDYALYPHMPMNTPGYDCRVHQVMSDWMVSIPAVRKHPEIPEMASGVNADPSPQPYVEIAPGDPRFPAAQAAATKRLAVLHTGQNSDVAPQLVSYSRYADCPDTEDIFDPEVLRDPTCHPIPIPMPVNASTDLRNGTPLSSVSELAQIIGAPDHAHWVPTDLTPIAGAYSPRRVDWPTVLVGQVFGAPAPSCLDSNASQAQAEQNEVKLAVDILQSAKLDDLRAFATSTFPMGLWQTKPGCHLTGQPTVGSYTGDARPAWMDNPASSAAASASVYAEWPGKAVYDTICINCHGPKADAHGRLADNLAQMTGGGAIVADFRDGLFGPVGDPTANRASAFGDSAFASLPPGTAEGSWPQVGVDDRAARYMAWMGSGGTQVNIPLPVLQIVSNTRVLGVSPKLSTGPLSANMLAVAKYLCNSVLFADVNRPWFKPDATGTFIEGNPALVATNGDAELWLHLCSQGNPPPIRALHGSQKGSPGYRAGFEGKIILEATPELQQYSFDLFFPGNFETSATASYGPNPVGNERGSIDASGISATNLFPYCFRKSSAAPTDTPLCPDAIDDGTPTPQNGGIENTCLDAAHCPQADDADRWATRGAINAGFAVYLYLDALMKGAIAPLPDYTACEQLP